MIGGTSAVAPLWAALIAGWCSRGGKPLGLMQQTAVRRRRSRATPVAGFRDITSGSNGAYSRRARLGCRAPAWAPPELRCRPAACWPG